MVIKISDRSVKLSCKIRYNGIRIISHKDLFWLRRKFTFTWKFALTAGAVVTSCKAAQKDKNAYNRYSFNGGGYNCIVILYSIM